MDIKHSENNDDNRRSFTFNGHRVIGLVIAGLFVIGVVLFLNFFKYKYNNNSASKTNQLNGYHQSINSTNHLNWILQYHFLSLVLSNKKALSQFQNSKIFVILSNKQLTSSNPLSNPDHLNLIPTDYINNYQKFVNQYDQGLIKYPIKAVLFDDSSDTPSSVVPTIEAKNPLKYDQLLNQFSVKHGLISMCDFILAKRTDNKKAQSPPCQVVVMNYPQQSERNSSQYFSVVNKAVQVVAKNNKNYQLYAGLSTNPRGSDISANELVQAVQATRHLVTGYWISIPKAGGIGCPNCSKQNPQLLPEFLAELNN